MVRYILGSHSGIPPDMKDSRLVVLYEQRLEYVMLEAREDARALILDTQELSASVDAFRKFDSAPLPLAELVDYKRRKPKSNGSIKHAEITKAPALRMEGHPDGRLLMEKDNYGMHMGSDVPPEMSYAADVSTIKPIIVGRTVEEIAELEDVGIVPTSPSDPQREVKLGQGDIRDRMPKPF